MKTWHVVINRRWGAQKLAWSALTAIAVLLALLLQSLAASALVTLHFRRNVTRRALCTLRVVLVLLVLGLASAAGQSTPAAAAQATPTATNPDTSSDLALASALVDALNRGDEGGIVALFDPEATVTADRYAWTHFEIRLWARAQIAASIVIEPEAPYQAVPNRAMWTARVRRADWRERGVDWVRMSNRILTEDGRIMDFTSVPLDGASVLPLGNLWRPGSTPDRIPPLSVAGDPQRVSTERQAGTLPVAALASVMGGVFLVAGVRRLRPQAVPPRTPGTQSALLAQLEAWLHRRDMNC
jgi:hypothetical protein